ncbi:MAG: hypothetical protein FMNOHCHN_03850 [Ignavibacteriaceae bacterium]|nr:hypothetical protein [Ignavibacteriaceae bacterium]
MKQSDVISTQAGKLLELQNKVDGLVQVAEMASKKAEKADFLRKKYHTKYKLIKNALQIAKDQAAYYQKRYTESRSIELFTNKELVKEILMRNGFTNHLLTTYAKLRSDKRKTNRVLDRIA